MEKSCRTNRRQNRNGPHRSPLTGLIESMSWKVQAAEGGPCESGKVEQTPKAIEMWASQLATRFNGRPIAVALEQSRGPVVFSLTKYSHLHLFPVHPSMLAHFREAMVPSGAKNDPGDTGLLLELLVHHRSRL